MPATSTAFTVKPSLLAETVVDMTNGSFPSDGPLSARVGTRSREGLYAQSALIGWIMIASLAA